MEEGGLWRRGYGGGGMEEEGVWRRREVRRRRVPVLSCIYYPATCGPKGRGSGSTAADATAAGFFKSIRILSQTDIAGQSRAPLSPTSQPPKP